MKNIKTVTGSNHFTSTAFLENVMPQIKISQNRFPLKGLAPVSPSEEVAVGSQVAR